MKNVLLLWLLPLLAPAQARGPMSIVELTDYDNRLQPAKLQALGQRYADVDLRRWQDANHLTHLVAYAPKARVQELLPALKQAYPTARIKEYAAPFYRFERSRCADKTTAKQWDNIILTASLVADTAKQHEYLRYHATQFQEWPEVSNGFCNASFQQLLVFRRGRELMLVISIPKGQSLDALNPKTTENNPRVDEWNQRMRQYQEGRNGAKPGEVWVFLQPLPPLPPLPAKPKQPVKKG
ncbi:L-rhamnose mutarotase [Hymenobacter sp. 15J16-1T3B]|uniref:L-rhamnose mutarotase n=1 Tax=Hymenobacter sp. 15J16-1T3B TaxID=2886941 RepID=UPI001D12B114|nr:L-rhamnose mutarotase [Hymenobacter sp. 15J16-1T3B]MCC3160399.1 L-rhamnose mutarotase [Hymenobacter sp. 15J16-1T3B]